MATAAARAPQRRSGGRRLLFVLAAVVIVVVALLIWLSIAAQAAVAAQGLLTVYRPVTSLRHGSAGAFTPASTGTLVQAGDAVQTDTLGRASVTLPDGSTTRLATSTTVTLESAHFTKTGSIHDAKFLQQVGRTLTSVEHLVSGATFQVAGQSATATVRGTKFEVYITPDGTMLVKLFEGTLDFDGRNHVHLVAGEQATADPSGNIGNPVPIQPDPNDPFGPDLAASNQAETDTTPGTEQDYIGAPIHNGETRSFAYSYAGGSLVKASLGYPGSAMSLTIKAPDGSSHAGKGPSPIVVQVDNAPSGIYTITVTGVSGIGPAGETPFVAIASVEQCASADVDQDGAIHRGLSSADLESSISVSGLTNLHIAIEGDSPGGAIISATGTYNGIGWSGVVVMIARKQAIDIIPVTASVIGLNVPAAQVLQQIGNMIGQDPSNINPGFFVDRLFMCSSVLMIDGQVSAPGA